MTLQKSRSIGYRFCRCRLLIAASILAMMIGCSRSELEQVRKERATITWVEENGGICVEENGGTSVYLGGLTDLDVIQLSDISPLAKLKDVKVLDLDYTTVSDISPLAELKNLTSLRLGNTKVSDLSPLAELKNLETLNLFNTPVSDEQVQELRQALPNCEIRSRFNVLPEI